MDQLFSYDHQINKVLESKLAMLGKNTKTPTFNHGSATRPVAENGMKFPFPPTMGQCSVLVRI